MVSAKMRSCDEHTVLFDSKRGCPVCELAEQNRQLTQLNHLLNTKEVGEKTTITYRGWAGHFICAQDCLFRLNTLVEYGDTRIVVSTVGLMVNKYEKNKELKFVEIGYKHYFETMTFHAKEVKLKTGNCWDADVSRELNGFFRAYDNIDDELLAQAGHETVVAEIAQRLENGETFKEVTE